MFIYDCRIYVVNSDIMMSSFVFHTMFRGFYLAVSLFETKMLQNKHPFQTFSINNGGG